MDLIQPEIMRFKVAEPILLLGKQRFSNVDIRIRVKGGGHVSQIYAIRQAIAKALVAFYQKCARRRCELSDVLQIASAANRLCQGPSLDNDRAHAPGLRRESMARCACAMRSTLASLRGLASRCGLVSICRLSVYWAANHERQLWHVAGSCAGVQAERVVCMLLADVDEQSKKEIKDLLLSYDRTLLVADPRRCEPKKCVQHTPLVQLHLRSHALPFPLLALKLCKINMSGTRPCQL